MITLVLHGCHVIERGVMSLSLIVHLDVTELALSGFRLGAVAVMVHVLGFEGLAGGLGFEPR